MASFSLLLSISEHSIPTDRITSKQCSIHKSILKTMTEAIPSQHSDAHSKNPQLKQVLYKLKGSRQHRATHLLTASSFQLTLRQRPHMPMADSCHPAAHSHCRPQFTPPFPPPPIHYTASGITCTPEKPPSLKRHCSCNTSGDWHPFLLSTLTIKIVPAVRGLNQALHCIWTTQ